MTQPAFLYVDNDELSREVMHALLTRGLGYQALTILETSHAFEEQIAMLDPKPDVIFLDIHMEPIDGFEMLELIHQNPDFETTPVIALTASVMNEEVRNNVFFKSAKDFKKTILEIFDEKWQKLKNKMKTRINDNFQTLKSDILI